MFLNMLIAVMSDTFDNVREMQKESALKETIGLMADYAVAVPRFTEEERQSRFIYTVKPLLGDNELPDWEGTVT